MAKDIGYKSFLNNIKFINMVLDYTDNKKGNPKNLEFKS